jgi:hypothetical protein
MAEQGDQVSQLSVSSRPLRRWKATSDSSKSGNWSGTRSPTWREAFEELVDSGQLEVVHGGWVQHDEALSTVSDTLDLFELGLRYMDSLLGRRTRIAWQIDTFGHTGSTPLLLRRLGFLAVFLTRVPQQGMAKLRRLSRLEALWGRPRPDSEPEPPLPLSSSSSSWREDEIFVHIPLDGTYAFPKGFDQSSFPADLDGHLDRKVFPVTSRKLPPASYLPPYARCFPRPPPPFPFPLPSPPSCPPSRPRRPFLSDGTWG